MNHLTRSDYAMALQLLVRIEAQAGEVESFARAVAVALNDFVGSASTTLSVSDLTSGHRRVVSTPGALQGGIETTRSDPSDFLHPLARCLVLQGGGHQPLAEPPGPEGIRGSGLYVGMFCHRDGNAHVVTVPLYHDEQTLVSMVLNRQGPDFNERDRQRLELMCPHLAFLCAHACHALGAPSPLMPPRSDPAPVGLTAREREVLQWLARGKTDAEIATLLAISPRTVNKHLEHVYVKLGVETRTAAVMRAMSVGLVDGRVPLASSASSAHGLEAPPWPDVQPAVADMAVYEPKPASH